MEKFKMKRFKKFISVIFALVIILSLSPSAFAVNYYTVTGETAQKIISAELLNDNLNSYIDSFDPGLLSPTTRGSTNNNSRMGNNSHKAVDVSGKNGWYSLTVNNKVFKAKVRGLNPNTVFYLVDPENVLDDMLTVRYKSGEGYTASVEIDKDLVKARVLRNWIDERIKTRKGSQLKTVKTVVQNRKIYYNHTFNVNGDKFTFVGQEPGATAKAIYKIGDVTLALIYSNGWQVVIEN
jgi:hypothetical protein